MILKLSIGYWAGIGSSGGHFNFFLLWSVGDWKEFDVWSFVVDSLRSVQNIFYTMAHAHMIDSSFLLLSTRGKKKLHCKHLTFN